MIESVLFASSAFLLPYLVPLILLLGAILFADRLIDLLRGTIGAKGFNKRRS